MGRHKAKTALSWKPVVVIEKTVSVVVAGSLYNLSLVNGKPVMKKVRTE